MLDKNRHLPAERVKGIWPQRVEVDATLADLKALPPYEEPVVETPRARPAASSRACGTCSAELGRPAPRAGELERHERKDGQLAQQHLRGRRRVGR